MPPSTGPRPLFPPGTPLTVFDRLQRALQPGQIVLYRNEVDLLAHIVAVGPVVHPNAPAGLMQVKVHVEDFVITLPGGMPQERIVIVGQREMPTATGPQDGLPSGPLLQ